ncbi:hypothetical protein [Sandaracinus amylolyticus]|uniref:hypothetical protein n=1 Tax=Sandaracinus amylolyticus TaxID=927083 RepID=UPI001F243075|nr:hypothetical protein [Sandaracinus amylolyticus]UJR79147.1 Hypothetical protein I5071_11800 [Sandaracinus amylolyticus]
MYVDDLVAWIREALARGDSPVAALRYAMHRNGGHVGRVDLIGAFHGATRIGLANAMCIGAWHVFGERLSDEELDAELAERLRHRASGR